MLEVRNVSKSFGAVRAIKELSFSVKKGELFVLLGPTGAGKTTTLRLIAGLEQPDQGQIFIDNEDFTKVSISNRDVAFVFQQYSLYPHYTVFQNMAFPLKSPSRKAKWPKDKVRARVEEIARLLRIEKKLGNKATQLSGGEMQRVAIGRALVRNPRIFLMDEPLSSLDAKLREEFRVELKRIQIELEATILYVTHDQVEALTMADKIGVMSEGELVQVGSPEEIYRRPNSIYVAQRLGSPSINILQPGLLNTKQPNKAGFVGIRPEDIVIDLDGNEAKIQNIEYLGAESVISLDYRGKRVVVLSERLDLELGQRVGISVRENRELYFESDGRLMEVE